MGHGTGQDGNWARCRGCGTQLRTSSRFCTMCGLEVTASPPPPPQSALPTRPQHTVRPAPPAEPAQPVQPPRAARRRPGPEHRRTNVLAIVAAVVVVAGGAAAGIVLGHPFGGHLALAATRSTPPPKRTAHPSPPPSATPSGTPSATPSAAPQATASPATTQQAATSLAALLAQSGADRQAVSSAYNDVLGCGAGLSQDLQAFQAAAASHQRLLGELAQLPGLSTLPTAMVADLKTAWQASISADEDFAKWTQDEMSSGCSTSSQPDPNFTAATQPDLQATTSKTAFVALWNPLAQTYGLPTYTQGNI